MKKLITAFILLLTLQATAQSPFKPWKSVKQRKEEQAQRKKITPQQKERLLSNNNRWQAKTYGISGAIVCGVGALVVLGAALDFQTTRYDRPADIEKKRHNRNVVMTIGGCMVAGSIPLFVLSRYHSRKYQAFKRTVVVDLRAEPVIGFQGSSTSVAAVGLRIGL